MTRAGLPLVLIVFTALGLAYANATPAWQNPDEPAHYNYVAYVAETGGLPELRPGDWDSAFLERLKTGQLQPGDSVSSIRYESWQPPLYYLVAAQLFRIVPTPDKLHLLRTFDVLLGAATVLVAYFVGRALFSSRWLALALALTVAGMPMFTSVSSAVSADPLANLLAACLTLALLKSPTPSARRPLSGGSRGAQRSLEKGPAVQERPHGRRTLLIAVLLGLGLLTKLALAIYIPLALWQARRCWRDMLTIVVVPGLILAPWLVHQVTTYGWLDPFATARHAQVVQDQPRFPGLSTEYVAAFATTTFHSFWAQFGWMALPAPDRLYWIWGALTALAVLGLLIRRREPPWQLMLAVVGLSLLAYVGYNLAYLQLQGRYLFIGLVPICALLVRGWSAWVPGRTQPLAALGVATLLVGLNAYALLRVLEPGFGH